MSTGVQDGSREGGGHDLTRVPPERSAAIETEAAQFLLDRLRA